MTTAVDKWSAWLLEKRFGGDAEAAARGMAMLAGVRDSILNEAKVSAGETVLDAGCGDGLIAFGALDRVGENGRVIFADISEPMLDRSRELASKTGVEPRCAFVRAAADDLSPIASSSVDVVTTRSVLIYVADKPAAFREFHRVLRPGGRIALWEPLNRFTAVYDREHDKFADRMPAIGHLWRRYHDRLRQQQPLDTDPMMNFDETDLLRQAEIAGFPIVHLAHHVYVMPSPPVRWDAWLNTSGNPNIPTVGATLWKIFSDDELELFEQHARPLLEGGGLPYRSAHALLTASKAREA